jgi:hypothetical protein
MVDQADTLQEPAGQGQTPLRPLDPDTSAEDPARDLDPDTAAEDRPLDPEKLLRLAGLVRAVLDEVRQMDPDQTTAAELAGLHRRVTSQVADALPNALREELAAIDLGYPSTTGEAPETGPAPTGQEARVAYAALIGWLSGLFQGLQAAMQYQQLQGLAALQEHAEQQPAHGEAVIEPGTGHYL